MAYRNDVEVKGLRPNNEKDIQKIVRYHEAGNLCATEILINKVSPNEKIGCEVYLKLLEKGDETAIETVIHKADVTTECGDTLLRALAAKNKASYNLRIIGLCNIRNEACRSLLAYIYGMSERYLRMKIADMANPDNQAGRRFVEVHLRASSELEDAKKIDPNTPEGSERILALFKNAEMIGFTYAFRSVDPNTEIGRNVLLALNDAKYRATASAILSKANPSNAFGRACIVDVALGRGTSDERYAARAKIEEWADPESEEDMKTVAAVREAVPNRAKNKKKGGHRRR